MRDDKRKITNYININKVEIYHSNLLSHAIKNPHRPSSITALSFLVIEGRQVICSNRNITSFKLLPFTALSGGGNGSIPRKLLSYGQKKMHRANSIN